MALSPQANACNLRGNSRLAFADSARHDLAFQQQPSRPQALADRATPDSARRALTEALADFDRALERAPRNA